MAGESARKPNRVEREAGVFAPARRLPAYPYPERLIGLLLVAVTVVAYTNVYRAGFIWDDDDYVTENPLLPAQDGLARIWTTTESPQYYPLVFTSFWLECRLWGLQPGGYHTVNVLLHALNAVLVWRLLRRAGLPGALLVGALFALHPVHVESVAWVTERKNVLSGFLYLLSIWAYWRFEERGRNRWYFIALALFVGGLLAKTVVCTLPVALLLLRWWRRQPLEQTPSACSGGLLTETGSKPGNPRGLNPAARDPAARGAISRNALSLRYVLLLAPFVVIGAALGALTIWYEHQHVLHGALGPHWQLSLAERILVAGRALWFYPAKLLWPVPLIFNYPRWEIDTNQITVWLWPASALLLAPALWKLRTRIGRGPLVGACYTALTLSPALGFINVAPLRFSFVADHFQYLASLGVLATLVGGANWLLNRRRKSGADQLSPPIPKYAIALAFLLLLACAALTVRQTQAYASAETLWRHTLQHNPDSWLARINLGVLLRQEGHPEDAQREFEQVLTRNADVPEACEHAHVNLGHLARQRGDLGGALAQYRQALQIEPDMPEALFSLAATCLDSQDYTTAAELCERYLERNPADARAHFNCALAQEHLSKFDLAEFHLLRALENNPELPAAHVRLAHLYLGQQKLEAAQAQLAAALNARPQWIEVRLMLADLLASRGRTAEARALLEAGLKLDPQATELQQRIESLDQPQAP